MPDDFGVVARSYWSNELHSEICIGAAEIPIKINGRHDLIFRPLLVMMRAF